jgi:hypothetical protein
MTHVAQSGKELDRMMAFIAGIMILSGLAHVPIWWWSGQTWDGVISWRKPILFGISGGLTLWSLAWVWSLLPQASWDDVTRRIASFFLLTEVTLITFQIWRGQPSHFNRTSWWNARIDEATLFFITIVVVIIGWVTIRSMGRINTDSVTAMSIRAGMIFLAISCLLGYVTSFVGYQLMNASFSPEKIGSAGSLKFPHGACLHAIQTLPLLVWVRRAMDLPATSFHMRHWIGAHAAYLSYAVWQTSQGLGRWQPDSIGVILLVFTAINSLFAWWPDRRRWNDRLG